MLFCCFPINAPYPTQNSIISIDTKRGKASPDYSQISAERGQLSSHRLQPVEE
jgi:hypothetical protein